MLLKPGEWHSRTLGDTTWHRVREYQDGVCRTTCGLLMNAHVGYVTAITPPKPLACPECLAGTVLSGHSLFDPGPGRYSYDKPIQP